MRSIIQSVRAVRPSGLTRSLAVIVLALGMAPACASAQVLGYRPVDARHVAYDNGYREGLRLGTQHVRRGLPFDPRRYDRERRYLTADYGYRREYGHREDYRRAFRSGYAVGYADAYRSGRHARRPVYGPSRPPGVHPPARPYGVHPVAYERGFEDGYQAGLQDARRAGRHDVLQHRRYRAGDRGYSSRHGSRQEYANLYRDGFRAGYDAGFREARWR